MVNNRSSNIELLRIISIFLIIIYHFFVHSNFELTYDFSFNNLFLCSLSLYGKMGVNIFVLISGYFLLKSKPRVSKILYLLEKVLLYSVVIYAFGTALNIIPFDFVNMFFPISSGVWWFATVYFLLYILSPFINKVLTNLSKNEYLLLLLICGIYWCIVPFFLSKNVLVFNDLIWFFFVYSVGGYIKLYHSNSLRSAHYIFLSIFSLLIQYVILLLRLSKHYFSCIDDVVTFSNVNNFFIFIASISLFIAFKNINISNNTIVNTISSCVFGIYLLHDHPIMRKIIWRYLVCGSKYADSPLLPVVAIASSVLLFLSCLAIELLIKKLFSKPIHILNRKIDNYITDKLKRGLLNKSVKNGQ